MASFDRLYERSDASKWSHPEIADLFGMVPVRKGTAAVIFDAQKDKLESGIHEWIHERPLQFLVAFMVNVGRTLASFGISFTQEFLSPKAVLWISTTFPGPKGATPSSTIWSSH